MQRYFIEDKLIRKDQVIMNKEDSHHIKNVMRLNLKDQIIINTYEGKIYLAELFKIEKNSVTVSLLETLNNTFNPVELEVSLALTKKDSFEMAIQKITELGVRIISFFPAGRSVVKIDNIERKLQRYKTITKEASEQSERNVLPILKSYQSLSDIQTADFDWLLVAYEREKSQSLKAIMNQIKPFDKTLILIGPEGGFTEKEISKLN